MKFLSSKILAILALSIVVIGIVFYLSRPNNKEINITESSFSYNEDNEILVSAHRGGKGLNNYPENSVETIDFLYKKGIRIFEIDINASSDKKLMLFHDDKVNRTTNGSGVFRKKSFDELREYNLIDDFGKVTNFSINSFDEALEWIENKEAVFMVDIKRGVSLSNVIHQIEMVSLQKKCIIITYNLKAAKKVHEQNQDIKISVPIRNEKELDWALKSGIPKEKMVAFTGTRKPKQDLYNKIHENGLSIILGTLGNLDRQAKRRGDRVYEELVQLGVDIFATDRPLDVMEFLKENNY